MIKQDRHETTMETTNNIGNPIKVTVYASPPGDDPDKMYRQEWEYEGKPGEPIMMGKIDLPEGSGSHLITFHLRDNSGLRLSFPEKAEDAMYVAIGHCPRNKGNGGQIHFGPVEANRKILKVVDSNCGPACDLHYQLNFVAESGKIYPYDPIITNGGGGFNISFS